MDHHNVASTLSWHGLRAESRYVLRMAQQRNELLDALKLSRAYIAVRCGTPDPEDRGADQYLISLCAQLDSVILKAEAEE